MSILFKDFHHGLLDPLQDEALMIVAEGWEQQGKSNGPSSGTRVISRRCQIRTARSAGRWTSISAPSAVKAERWDETRSVSPDLTMAANPTSTSHDPDFPATQTRRD